MTEIALSDRALAQFATDELLRAASLLADARCQVIAWNGTSSGWLGFEADHALCREIEAVTGARACTSVLALNEALALVGASAAWAEVADPTVLIQARQAHYKAIGKAAKGALEQIKSPAPSVAAIRGYAKEIDVLAPQVSGWFPVGTGPEAHVKTAAKPDIWRKPDEFRRDTEAFIVAAHRFDAVATSGDLPAIRMEAVVLGETCKSCHQAFRTRDD